MLNLRWWLLACLCCALGSVTAAEDIAPTSASLIERQFPEPIDLAKFRLSAQNTLKFDGKTLRVLEDVPFDATLAQVAGQPEAAFRPFSPTRIYALNAKNALWLHFRVTARPEDIGEWSFELPKPFVDRVELYSWHSTGRWLKQQAGDHVPQSQWAVRGLHPQFQLPISTLGTNDFYIKVQQYFPLRFEASLKTTEEVIFRNQNTLLINGILIGLMALMGLFALAIALIYKSAVYPWYALYIVFATLSNASYVGLGFYAFWPTLPLWAELSHCVLIVAAFAALLQFSCALFVDDMTPKWLSRLVKSGVIFLAVTALLSAWIPANVINLRINVTVYATLIGIFLIGLIVTRKAYQGSLMAWVCLLAQAPVFVFLILTFVEQFGFMRLNWLPYDGIGYAVVFEALVLLMALHLCAKSRYALQVRQIAKDALDPLTGFLAASQYPDTLAQLWGHARASRQDLTIAYVAATVNPGVYGAANQPTSDVMVLRCVRMLRMVSRTDDTVARIQKNVFAILMPGISPGPSLAAKLSRLVALGLMRDPDDVTDQPVKFLIATTSFSSYSGTTSQVNQALQEKLAELNTSSERGIAFIKNK
jgi:two-component system, sensor histidine kinase LadS